MKSRGRVWDLWLAGTVGSFAALETYALVTGRIPPLTAVLRSHMGIAPRKRHGRVAPVLFLAFFGWLTAHLVEFQLRQAVEACRRLMLALAVSRPTR